jgi:hypothetical protein
MVKLKVRLEQYASKILLFTRNFNRMYENAYDNQARKKYFHRRGFEPGTSILQKKHQHTKLKMSFLISRSNILYKPNQRKSK